MKYSFQENDLSKNRYILYARKSTESEDRQVASIEDQISVMQEVAKENNLKIVEVMSESSSGFHTGRGIFNEMIQKIYNKEADGIIAWKLSRLSRNPVDSGIIMGLLHDSLINHIRTIDRNWFPTDNVMMMYIEFGMNNQYSRDLSIDTQRGLTRKAERGWNPSSTLPLGYMHSPLKKHGEEEIICDPERFEIIQNTMKMVASRRMTPIEAYNFIINSGIKTNRGKKISKSVFYYMLNNPFYAGRFEYPKNSGNWFEGKHIKALTEDEFQSIQSLFGKKDRPRPQKNLLPFTGLIKCGECGGTIIADPKVKRQKNGNIHEYLYYRCAKNKGKCNQKYLGAGELENQFKNLIDRIEIPEVFHEWALEELKKEQKKEVENRESITKTARKLYDEKIRMIDDLVEGWISKKIPEDVYSKKLVEYENDKQKYKKMLDNTDKRVNEWVDKATDLLNFTKNAREAFENGDYRKKNEIIQYLGSNLKIIDKKVSIEIQYPILLVNEIKTELNPIMKQFEPLKDHENKEEAKLYISNKKTMLRGQDSNL